MSELSLSDEDCELIVLQYLLQQRSLGREGVPMSELYELTGNQLDPGEEDMMVFLNERGEWHLELLLAKRHRQIN